MADPLDPETGYSFLAKAAAEARAASRKYWQTVDHEHPVAEDIERMWPLAGDVQPQQQQATPKTRRGFEGE